MSALPRQNVLIVDDVPINITLLADALQGDYEIFFATSAEQAWRVATTKPIDLILLDVMMPEVDGYELCRRLKLDPVLQEIPVIFVTAKTGIEDEVKGFGVGAVDYIVKPISPPIVQSRVKTHLELKRYRDHLRSLSSIDGITGLPNRRSMDETLERELHRAKRRQEPLSLFMIDIDFFKQYNDCYGHLAGDDCLKKVASALADTHERPGDFVARYGGEEFVMICPQTDSNGAEVIAEKQLSAIRKLAIPHEASRIADHLTISLGAVTLLPPIPDSGIEADALLKHADSLLYQAKSHGRNQYRHQSLATESS